MAITLSSTDLRLLARAMQVLIAPLDYPSADHWRAAVNRELKALLRADSAGFLLPANGIPTMLSEEHDASQLADYPNLIPPPLADGTPIFQRVIELGVTRLADAYDGRYDLYLASPYYNEFARPNKACDTLGVMISLGGADPGSVASLQYWHQRPAGKQFGTREVELLRLLFPAFRAGVETQLRWSQQRGDLLDAIDRLGTAAIVGDLDGRILHETPGVRGVFEDDAEAPLLRSALLEMLALVGATVRGASRGLVVAPCAHQREIATRAARYSVRGCLYGAQRGDGGRVVIVAIDRLTPVRHSDSQLRAAFSLTPMEIRVSRLLAQGRANVDIARELGMSPHTARRHTEQIFRKLDIRSRAEVAGRLSDGRFRGACG